MSLFRVAADQASTADGPRGDDRGPGGERPPVSELEKSEPTGSVSLLEPKTTLLPGKRNSVRFWVAVVTIVVLYLTIKSLAATFAGAEWGGASDNAANASVDGAAGGQAPAFPGMSPLGVASSAWCRGSGRQDVGRQG